jgi:hypothetical protein
LKTKEKEEGKLFKYKSKGVYTPTEKGIVYGLFFGGGIGFILYSFTGEIYSLALMGAGLVLGLIIGGSIPEKKKKTKTSTGKKK